VVRREEKLELLKKKSVYPYDYMDSFARFDETELPARKEFYSDLNNTNISEEEYERAKVDWNTFKIQNLGEYHDFYFKKKDVLLLADVFENFRETCLQHCKLDPCHYLACVAGEIRERASERRSRHIPLRSPRGNSGAAKLRVNFPPATFRRVFACRPLLSLLIIQLDKPIRERSLN